MEIFNFLYFRVYLRFRFLTVFFFFKRLFFERFVRRRDLPPFFSSGYPLLSSFFDSATGLFVDSVTALFGYIVFTSPEGVYGFVLSILYSNSIFSKIKNIVFFYFYDKYYISI